jgi:peptidoglycan/xylan/chitin deacetylase (PgdA/CDA1 family)
MLSRGALASLLAFASVCLLVTSDSLRPAPVAAAEPVHAFVSQVTIGSPSAWARQLFFSQEQVIAVGRGTIDVPILMYHYIRTPPSVFSDRVGYNLSVAPSAFNEQMDWLAAHRYHPVDFDDMRAYFAGQRALPGNPVVITLDDGYADLYTAAYPILRAHGFKAVAYIVSSFMGQPRYATAAEVREMSRHGIEIASHTIDHPNLARSSPGSIMHQLVASKSALESLLGRSVLDFAYPSGKFSGQVVAEVEAAGYSTAVTEMSSTRHSWSDRYTWTRVRVGGGEVMADFIHNLGPLEPTVPVILIDLQAPVLTLPDVWRAAQRPSLR